MTNHSSFSKDKLKTLFQEKPQNPNSKSLTNIKKRLIKFTTLLRELGEPASEGAFLLVAKEDKAQFCFHLDKDIINIGRSAKVDIPLDDDNVSRFHCRLEKEDDFWEVSDLDSKNGISVNEKKCKKRILCDGDVIKIGIYELYFQG